MAIHGQVIKRFGGSHDVRDLSLLDSAVARSQVSFDGKDMYETLFDKAGALFHSILKNHSFVDGNKRTAYSSVAIFLKQNGYNLTNRHKEAVEFSVTIETENLVVNDIAKWLKKNSKRIS